MKLLDHYEAACKVRRLAARTIPTYKRWVEEFLRFHHDRTGRWIHPQEMGEREVEAFLTHFAVNRRVAESTQNQALGAILFLYRKGRRANSVGSLCLGWRSLGRIEKRGG
jgi:site-specific recombinase XerD